jgi:hypothetical protein
MIASSQQPPNGLTVTIAISTLGAGVEKIGLPPPSPGISFLILVQDAPEGAGQRFSDRPDVTLHCLDTIGVAKSRNAALDLAQGDLVVFGDDDLIWNIAGIQDLRDSFKADPKLDLVLAWRQERRPLDVGPNKPLTRFNSGRAGAPEMIIRLSAIREHGIRFDTDFGLGGRYGIGEEYVFITDALRAGLHGLSMPVITCSHPHDSTGDNWSDPTLLQGRHAILKRVFGPLAILVRPVYAVRHRRKFTPKSLAFWFALGR